MFRFENKKILILSPNSWGKIHISKHHYAIELSQKGNIVYFVNPPDKKKPKFLLEKTEFDNLYIISYKPLFSFKIRFHLRSVYNYLMKFQIKFLLRKLNFIPDVLWCFDFNLFSDLRLFKAKTTIFHPVDPVIYDYQINPAKSADVVFSVSEKILSNFKRIRTPHMMVNHGVEKQFETLARLIQRPQKAEKTSVGYFGNLLRPVINRDFIRKIINENPNVDFHFWGPLSSGSSNIGGNSDQSVIDFINYLQSNPNVILHGVAEKKKLIESIIENEIDVFILVYSDVKGSSDRSNAHKLIEYLSTGKVTVANLFSTYKDFNDLIVMPEKDDDSQLPALFKQVVNNLDYYNSPELQQKRKEFALDNTYKKQIERIEIKINTI